jgi:hypothetical protein
MSNRGHKLGSIVTLSALAAALCAGAAYAAPGPPTLHGFCSTAVPCTDNGANTPTAVNPPDFGFSAGGHAATGDVLIDILVPEDGGVAPSSYTLSGAFLGVSTFTASLVSPTAWSSGFLDSYLGISASPANPIGGFLDASETTLEPAATGFYVFQADIGTRTLPSNSGASDADLMTTDRALFAGTYIVAFIHQSGGYGATAPSGAILETSGGTITGHGGVPEPAAWVMMLTGSGLVGAMVRRRRLLAA